MNHLPTLSWASMPSTLKGAARAVDMFGQMDEYKTTPAADLDLIKNDWENVGNDLRVSIDTYEQEQTSSCLAKATGGAA